MPEKKTKRAEIKTKETSESVEDFLNSIQDEQKRVDSFELLEIMKLVSGCEPRMWGGAIIGFGNSVYTSPATGREVDWFVSGFSPRKANLSVYLAGGLKRYSAALEKLGKHKTSVGCLYIKKLADVDNEVLRGMIEESFMKT